MRPYVVLNKEVGQTPLEALEAWRRDNPAYASVPLTYAGRLDPMASGMLLVLVGEECKNQEKYRGLDKEYEVEVLLRFGTDTGDALGMPVHDHSGTDRDIATALALETGTRIVPYPAFSSKTVNGKPLFLHALEGTLGSIAIPTHAETIYRIERIGTEHLKKEVLKARIEAVLAKAPRAPEGSKALGADFRQDRIRAAWEKLFSDIPDQDATVLALRVTCASGTYMRTLAERIGERLGTEGMALSIRRTRIGRFHRLPFLGFWSTQY